MLRFQIKNFAEISEKFLPFFSFNLVPIIFLPKTFAEDLMVKIDPGISAKKLGKLVCKVCSPKLS
jgi:hypothetical protein